MQRVATAKWDEIVYELAFSFPLDISAIFGFHTLNMSRKFRLKLLSPSEGVSPYCAQLRHRRVDRGTELCKGSLIIMRINFLSSTLPLCFLVVAYLFVSKLTKTTILSLFLFKISRGYNFIPGYFKSKMSILT